MADPRPELRTARLALTPLAATDVDALGALLSLEPVRRYLLDGNAPDRSFLEALARDSDADFARRGLGLWVARPVADARLVGLVGFRDFHEPPVEELVYALHPDAWGRGLAREMAAAAIDHAVRALGRDRVRASTDAPNEASLRVLRRLGLREVAREPCPPGCLWDQIHCVVDRAQWQRRATGD